MISLNYNEISSLESLYEKHFKIKDLGLLALNEISNLNIPLSVYISLQKEYENACNERLQDFISNLKELSSKQCLLISEQLITDYNECEKVDFGKTLDVVGEIIKYIKESLDNYRRFEIIIPKMFEFFLEDLKANFKRVKSSLELEIEKIKKERSAIETKLTTTKDLYQKNIIDLESEVDSLKEELKSKRLEV